MGRTRRASIGSAAGAGVGPNTPLGRGAGIGGTIRRFGLPVNGAWMRNFDATGMSTFLLTARITSTVLSGSKLIESTVPTVTPLKYTSAPVLKPAAELK